VIEPPLPPCIAWPGQARTAKAFAHQTNTLRWAEEQRLIIADAATGIFPIVVT